MRILLAQPGPDFSVQDVYAGWLEALQELGCHVVEFNLSDRLAFYENAFFQAGQGVFRKALPADKVPELAVNGLYASLYKTRPDVLIAVSGFFLDPDMLDHIRRMGTRIVLIHTECPYEDEHQLRLAAHVDVNLVNDPINIERYAELATSRYVPHAYRPALHKPGPPDPDLAADFIFIGTGYPSRIQFLERMDFDGMRVMLGGNWKPLQPASPLYRFLIAEPEACIDNTDTVRAYQSARAGMNLYRREGETPETTGWAMGPREVEMAACGLFFIRDPRPEGDQVLPMLPTFTSPEEASELLRWHLQHDQVRTKLAGQAREAIADRTFHAHAAALLRLLENKE